MNYKFKSVLYFSGLVIALVTYYNVEATNAIQETQLVENNIEQTVTQDALN
jgi:hypothetical protein